MLYKTIFYIYKLIIGIVLSLLSNDVTNGKYNRFSLLKIQKVFYISIRKRFHELLLINEVD